MLVSLFSERYEVVPSILLFDLFFLYGKIETICREDRGKQAFLNSQKDSAANWLCLSGTAQAKRKRTPGKATPAV